MSVQDIFIVSLVIKIKRKKIKVLTEGSTFSRIVEGRVVYVTPESFKSHRVIRYALSYLLPYKT